MSGAKLLGTVLRSVAGSRAARTVKEIMPRRISFVPAEKPESLNRDMERLRFVPLNGPGAAAAARHASKKDSSEKDEDDGEEDDDEEEDEDDEDDEEDNDNPLGFPSSHLRDLTVWYTALSATKRTEMRNVGAGLVNVGNTCFLDATLQCLTHTVPFASYFLAGDIAESHNSSTCLFAPRTHPHKRTQAHQAMQSKAGTSRHGKEQVLPDLHAKRAHHTGVPPRPAFHTTAHCGKPQT